ncbi:hypothetical protein HispidOSU_017286 [Sigmodon hispidus]
MSVWCPCSILKPEAILVESVMLRAQTSPTRPQSLGEPRLQSVEPPAWLLQDCLTQERIHRHSISTQKPTLRKMPLYHADLIQSMRAEKVGMQSADCKLIPRAISWSPYCQRHSESMPAIIRSLCLVPTPLLLEHP